jgi:hypothetical protein
MTFVLSFLISALANGSCSELSPDIQKAVEKSTFKLVPRNLYAETMTEATARSIHQKSCLTQALTISDQMNCRILESCTGNTCKIQYGPVGSAFLAEKSGKLFTAWHVVFPTHAAALIFLQGRLSLFSTEELNSTLAVMEPDFVLLDGKDQVVFDSQKSPARYADWGNPLSTVYQMEGHKQHRPYGYMENAPDDYVAIDIGSAHLGEGLPITTLTKKEDLSAKCLHSGGFPYHDGKFRISTGTTASVKSMQSQISYVIPFQLNPFPMEVAKILQHNNAEILKMMGYSDEKIQTTMEKYDDLTIRRSIELVLATQPRHLRDQLLEAHPAVLFYDAKVLPGQSGGPIVDDTGTVVGITTNSFLDKTILTDGHFTSFGAAGFFLGSLK